MVFRLYFLIKIIFTLFAVISCKPVLEAMHETVCKQAGCEDSPDIICSKYEVTSDTNPFEVSIIYQCLNPQTNEVKKTIKDMKVSRLGLPYEFIEYERETWQGGQYS